MPIKVAVVEASDPHCELEMEKTPNLTISRDGYVDFSIKVITIGKSFRIRAMTTDGGLCCQSLQTYRVVWAKLHVENAKEISETFHTKARKNSIKVDVSIKDRNGDYVEGEWPCDVQCTSIISMNILTQSKHRIFVNGKCRMEFRPETLTGKGDPFVFRILCPTQCSGVGYTELNPITVKFKPHEKRPNKEEAHGENYKSNRTYKRFKTTENIENKVGNGQSPLNSFYFTKYIQDDSYSSNEIKNQTKTDTLTTGPATYQMWNRGDFTKFVDWNIFQIEDIDDMKIGNGLSPSKPFTKYSKDGSYSPSEDKNKTETETLASAPARSLISDSDDFTKSGDYSLHLNEDIDDDIEKYLNSNSSDFENEEWWNMHSSLQ
mmetsp:Transcript_21693/g.31568  ORF Transcript_21693/g.31568 Transcript_21693/m.31568 type:complete len:376 (+) Transcript_21693:244-1371(+)